MCFQFNVRFLVFFIFSTFLLSCSSTHQAYLRTISLALDESKDINLETSDISESPVDFIYVKKGSFSTIVLALAFIENGQYKWISSDKAALIEKNGRIIKTLALEHNLDFLTAQNDDPLAKIIEVHNPPSWYRTIDFDNKHFGVQVSSNFELKGTHILTIQERNIETVLIEERVNILENNIHQFSPNEWTNEFWLDRNSGQVIRSKQKVLPNGEYFDITYVSRALRL
tara:strand:+ start:582 stop:1262 length:681 start_codon:yes stop_codon:yes gene_type:complete